MPDGDKYRRISRVARTLMIIRWALLVVLPPLGALLGASAATSSGEKRTYLVLGLIFIALLLAALQIYGEVREWRARKSATIARADLAGALGEAGLPLLAMLGRVAEASTLDERRAQVTALVNNAVGIAASQCGRLAGIRCHTRGVFYRFSSVDRLSLVHWAGRTGHPPRADFDRGRSDNDRRVITKAASRESLLVPDVDEAASEEYEKAAHSEYKSFLLVPVRTDRQSYGFLSVDSDRVESLVREDIGYVQLIAGVMASALALLDQMAPATPSVAP